jgi:NAD(P)-dependent dehydrogenase (short-subunit alcohol dehydrogenase family)
VAQCLQAWGRLDIVVNNAGQIDPIGHLGETNPTEWAQSVAVNMTGAYHVVHAALAPLVEAKGVIVNVSTGAAHTPREGWSAYCSSKAGLAMLTRCIHHEYGAVGLSVFSLQPGVVDTDMQGRIRGSGMNEISRIPREKLAPADRPARLIAWLADSRPQDLAGQELTISDAQLASRAGLEPA